MQPATGACAEIQKSLHGRTTNKQLEQTTNTCKNKEFHIQFFPFEREPLTQRDTESRTVVPFQKGQEDSNGPYSCRWCSRDYEKRCRGILMKHMDAHGTYLFLEQL